MSHAPRRQVPEGLPAACRRSAERCRRRAEAAQISSNRLMLFPPILAPNGLAGRAVRSVNAIATHEPGRVRAPNWRALDIRGRTQAGPEVDRWKVYDLSLPRHFGRAHLPGDDRRRREAEFEGAARAGNSDGQAMARSMSRADRAMLPNPERCFKGVPGLVTPSHLRRRLSQLAPRRLLPRFAAPRRRIIVTVPGPPGAASCTASSSLSTTRTPCPGG